MRVFKILLLILISLQILSEGLISYYSREPFREEAFNYVLLLGIGGHKNNILASDRAFNSAEALKRWPEAKLIITGNEAKNEVTDLKELVLALGVPLDKIIEEPNSQSTWDNITFSQKLIPPNSTTLIITNEFHQNRALAIARVHNLKASTYGKDRVSYPRSLFYALRERAANLKWLFLFLKYKIL